MAAMKTSNRPATSALKGFAHYRQNSISGSLKAKGRRSYSGKPGQVYFPCGKLARLDGVTLVSGDPHTGSRVLAAAPSTALSPPRRLASRRWRIWRP